MQISHYDTYFENPKFCADRLRGSPAIIAGVDMLFAAFLSEGLHFRGQSNTEFLRGKMKNEPFFSLNVWKKKLTHIDGLTYIDGDRNVTFLIENNWTTIYE